MALQKRVMISQTKIEGLNQRLVKWKIGPVILKPHPTSNAPSGTVEAKEHLKAPRLIIASTIFNG